MRLTTCHRSALLAASASICVASCSAPVTMSISSPSARTFVQEPKPTPSLAVLLEDDGEGYRRYQGAKDRWGSEGWARLADVCLWFVEQGVEGLPCKPDAGAVKGQKSNPD